MRSPQLADIEILSTIEKIPDPSLHSFLLKKRVPKTDLFNVITGHDPLSDTPRKTKANDAYDPDNPQEGRPGAVPTVDLDNWTALPHTDQATDQINATTVLLEKLQDHIQARLNNALSPALSNKTDGLSITDHNKVAELIADIKDTEPGNNPRSQKVELLLEYLTVKHQLALQEGNAVRPEDTPGDIQKNAAIQSRDFQQEMQNRKTEINRHLQDNNPGLSIKNNGIENSVRYLTGLHTTAAKLEAEARDQKIGLESHLNSARQAIGNVAPTQASRDSIEAQKEAAEAQLKPIYAKHEDAALASLKWAIEADLRQQTYNRNPTLANQTALKNHNQQRPADYDTHKNAITPQIREATPIIRDIAKESAKLQRWDQKLPSIRLAKLEMQLEAEINAYLKANNAVDPNDLNDNCDIQQDYQRLVEKNKLSPSTENHNAVTTAQQTLQNRHNIPPSEKIDNLIQQIAELEAKAEHNGSHANSDSEYALAKARIEYQGQIAMLAEQLEENKNPHPTLLENLQNQAKAIHLHYANQVKAIHQQAGSYDLLQEISAPLMALRSHPTNASADKLYNHATSISDKVLNAFGQPPINLTAPDGYLQNAAQLPPLDPNKYQLDGEDLPNILTHIDKLTAEINQLLEKRSHMETTIAAQPSMAELYKEDVAKNTAELQTTLSELAEYASTARQAGFLQTHPDIQEWARQAAALNDLINRRRIFDNATSKAFASPIFDIFSRKNKSGINPDTQYDPKQVDALKSKNFTTSYLVKEGKNWVAKDLKVKIPQEDGSEKLEEVTFSAKEIMEHCTNFSDENGLTGENAPEMKRDGNTIKIKWPDKKMEDWLKYLKAKYKEKHGVNNEKPEAKVEVEQPDGDPNAITANHLGA